MIVKNSEYQRLINPTLLVLSRVSFSLSFSYSPLVFSGRCLFCLYLLLSPIQKAKNISLFQATKTLLYKVSGSTIQSGSLSLLLRRPSFPVGIKEESPF
ncbi:hypothetical protein PAMP_001673 [Pampus punctatissimus]